MNSQYICSLHTELPLVAVRTLDGEDFRPLLVDFWISGDGSETYATIAGALPEMLRVPLPGLKSRTMRELALRWAICLTPYVEVCNSAWSNAKALPYLDFSSILARLLVSNEQRKCLEPLFRKMCAAFPAPAGCVRYVVH